MRLLAIHYYCYAYLLFTILYRVQEEIYGRKKTAVEETIKICMNRDILNDYREKDDKILLAQVLDKIEMCDNKNKIK